MTLGVFRLISDNRHYIVLRRISMVAGSVFLVTACDGKVHLMDAKISDFARSEIISNGPAVADGSAELLVAVNLMNSDGSSIQLFKPTYEITSGLGVQGAECTTSNANGISTCILRSTQAGVKRFRVTNVTKVNLERDLVFTPPSPPGTVASLVSAASRQTSGSGHVLVGKLGTLTSDPVKTNAEGWKLYGGPEGRSLSGN